MLGRLGSAGAGLGSAGQSWAGQCGGRAIGRARQCWAGLGSAEQGCPGLVRAGQGNAGQCWAAPR